MEPVMLSTIVLAADADVPHLCPPAALARTLGSLVPAVVAGLVRHLVVATLTTDPEAQAIASEAGCDIAVADRPEGILRQGLAAARGETLFVLRAGYAPGPSFADEVGDFLKGGGGRALFRIEPENVATRLFPGLARVEGVILPVRQAKPGNGLAALVRSAGSSSTLSTRLRRLR
jgi:hypothetical protein